MRLNKYLSESGACSRREADTFIEEGRVTVNGVPAVLGTQVNDGDDVRLDGDAVGTARKNVKPVYIALNKPVGITCTTERNVAGNIVDFVDHPERVFPIGRLDKDSEGLILLTNDGDIVNEVLRAEHNHEKEYVVAVDHAITPEFLTGMASGVRLSDATTKRCKVERLGAKLFKITLTQGLNRQIRRMCEALGYTVEALKRIRIMHVHLGQLPVGRWRNLTPHEVSALFPAEAAKAPHSPGGGYSSTKPHGGGGGSQPQRPGGGTQPPRGGGTQPPRPGGGTQPPRPGSGTQPPRPGGAPPPRPAAGSAPPQRVRHPSHGPRPGGGPNAPRASQPQRPGGPSQPQRPGQRPSQPQRAGGAPGPSGRGGPPPRRSGPSPGPRGRRGRG